MIQLLQSLSEEFDKLKNITIRPAEGFISWNLLAQNMVEGIVTGKPEMLEI